MPLNRFYKLPNPSHVWSSLIIISPPHLYERERSAGKENILYATCNIQVKRQIRHIKQLFEKMYQCKKTVNCVVLSLLKVYFFNLVIFVDSKGIWRYNPYDNGHWYGKLFRKLQINSNPSL